MNITVSNLSQLASAPLIVLNAYAPILATEMPNYGITGRLREAAFIAQILHESGGFRYTTELASGQAYEGRKDLGNTQKGDGVKYKGRGLIQITGRANYQTLSRDFGEDFIGRPELLALPQYAVKSACWFWNNKGLNAFADKGDFETITRRINGGVNGYEDRLKYYNKALSIFK